MPIPLADVTRALIVVRGVLAAGGSNAKNIANVFVYRRVAISVDPTKAALAVAFNTAVLQVYAAACNVDIASLTMNIRWLDDAEDLETNHVPAGFAAGQVAGERHPSHVCVSMLYRTAKRGQNYRGAKRFAGPSEGDSVDDVLSGAPLALWQALRDGCAAQFTDTTPNTWKPVVYSKSLSIDDANPTTIITNDVTSVLLNKNLGHQQRRRVLTVR